LDAEETLSQFMEDGRPAREPFQRTIIPVLQHAGQGGRHVRVFGEMVAFLWAQGRHTAAIELERLWNELRNVYSFSLLCAYPIMNFDGAEHARAFADICRAHSDIVPADESLTVATENERGLSLALLEQRARSLDLELEKRKRAEEALARRERELRDLVENAVEGLHQVGPDGRVLWANRAELVLLGYDRDEYVGRHIADFHTDARVIEDILTRLRRGEELYNYPAKLRCKNGSTKDVLIHSSGYFEEGRFLYSRCFTRDITERTQAEEEMRRLNDELKEKVNELEAFHDIAVHRELTMMQLKNDLRKVRDELSKCRCDRNMRD